jgi:hypothetical protein
MYLEFAIYVVPAAFPRNKEGGFFKNIYFLIVVSMSMDVCLERASWEYTITTEPKVNFMQRYL